MTHKIQIVVSDGQLALFEKYANLFGGGKCIDPLTLLQNLLQTEADNAREYVCKVLDDGGIMMDELFDGEMLEDVYKMDQL